MKNLLSAVLLLTLFISCTKDPEIVEPDFTAKNEKEISDYVTKNNLTAKRSDSGLYYVINEPGTGTQPAATSVVTVVYKGYFSDGKAFDQSTNAGIKISLNRVIKGWSEGMQYFKTGGSGILLVPSHLGYGSYNYNGIPGGSVLIFDVKLIAVE